MKVYQRFVEELVRSEIIMTNTGVFEVDGKEYILTAELKEVKSKERLADKK